MANHDAMSRTEDESRVLLLPPTRRDAEVLQKILARSSILCATYQEIGALTDALADDAGAVVVSEESLIANPERLAARINAQPVWSDLPLIVLSRSGAEKPALTNLLPRLGNVSVLERPVRVTTLLSVVRSALRARDRQYQVRDHLLELKHAQDAERNARAEAERAGRMKDEFLATLSHELRTPLNAILGWAQILKAAPPSPEDVTEGVDIIERNARAQTQIIEDLLDMSRIISGKIRLDVQRVDVAEVVRAAVDTVKPAANAKGISMRAVLDSVVLSVSGDPNRLQQVFWNLLTNAVKFTPKGGRVQVLLERVNSHLEISINDNGEGIDPQFLPHVFDRFRQADSSTTRRHGGLGLGLAIVKQLIELHGGTIRVKSPGKGAGSTFIVSLPLTVLHPDPDPDTALVRRQPGGARSLCEPLPGVPIQIKGLSVLVVDDEPDARSLLRRLLEDCEATVFAAASAAEAMELLESHRPEVLVSDIGMPSEDGYSLIRRIRSLPVDRGRNIPAVALTAYVRAEDRVTAILAGFQHHLAKPVEPRELIAIVAALGNRVQPA
jgi:signal transduction histidine kinase/CheY-like chemotaxis protein